jgi:hypothetical protein
MTLCNVSVVPRKQVSDYCQLNVFAVQVDQYTFPGHEQQKASKIHRISADPTQWLIRANKWREMRWWHFQLSKNPPSWPFNGHIAR